MVVNVRTCAGNATKTPFKTHHVHRLREQKYITRGYLQHFINHCNSNIKKQISCLILLLAWSHLRLLSRFPALSWLIWCLLLFTEEVWSEYSCPSLFTSQNTTYYTYILKHCYAMRREGYCSTVYCLLPSSNDSCSLRLCRVSRHLHHHPAHICSKLCPRCESSRLHPSQIHPALRIAFLHTHVCVKPQVESIMMQEPCPIWIAWSLYVHRKYL